MLAALAVLATLHLTGPVPVEGGDYLIVPFEVPAGTVELQLAHDDGSDFQILDWGVWQPDGRSRGWGGGLGDPAVIGVDASSRGYRPGAIEPGTWQVVIGKAKLGNLPGAYTIDIELRDAATLTPEARQPWTPVVLTNQRRWYAGDFHVHSRDSGDASASLDEIASFARSRHLDFVVLSDHNTSAQIAHQAAAQIALPDLLLVRGAEITTYHGHGNAVGTGEYVDHRVGLGGVTASTIVDGVLAQGGLFIVNHPALRLGDVCIGCAWDHADTPWAKVSGLEIQTGNSEQTGATFTPKAIMLWDTLQDGGARLAAIGGSDDHRGGLDPDLTASRIGSPTTMVLADVLSEESLLAAVRAGRTVVKMNGPDDPMVTFAIRGPVSRAEIGDTLTDFGDETVEVEAPGADGAIAELWRDGVQVASAPIAGGKASFARTPSHSPERYRVELTRDGRRLTVTSHIYVEAGVGADQDTGCGCTGGLGGVGPGAALGLLALRRRRRPARG